LIESQKEMIEPNLTLKILEFLREDLGSGDITTDAIIDNEIDAKAKIVCYEKAVISGVEEAVLTFNMLKCSAQGLIKDGDSVEADTEIIKVSGKARSILKAERTALNILGRMSGVATETNKLVKEAKQVNKKIRVAATRKTLPGLRIFDKKAVKAGGGDTHRFQLDDAVLIKDNHLKITGSISTTIKLARKNVSFTKKIEVEVSSAEEALEAVEAGVDIILLDNMVPQEISKIITILREKQLRKGVFLEASGGIKIENIRMYSETGVDAVSLGVITHSAKNIDFGLEIV
jgi:nicotinate-nucleotide pyrophosphorylase (carboxylating)